MKQSDYCTSFYSACNQPMFNKEIVEKNIKYIMIRMSVVLQRIFYFIRTFFSKNNYNTYIPPKFNANIFQGENLC